MKNIFYVWKITIIVLSIALAIHFLKDVTQDLLGIETVLDEFGNISEDTSTFSEPMLFVYHWGWVNATIFQLGIPILHLKHMSRQYFQRVDAYILAMVVWMIGMFLWTVTLR